MKKTLNATITNISKDEIEVLAEMFGDRITMVVSGAGKKNAPKPETIKQDQEVQQDIQQEVQADQDQNVQADDETAKGKKKWVSKAEYAAQFTDEERELRRNAKAYAKAEILRRVKEERNGRWFNYNTEYKPLFNKLVAEYEEAGRKAAEAVKEAAEEKKTKTTGKKATTKKTTGKTANNKKSA